MIKVYYDIIIGYAKVVRVTVFGITVYKVTEGK